MRNLIHGSSWFVLALAACAAEPAATPEAPPKPAAAEAPASKAAPPSPLGASTHPTSTAAPPQAPSTSAVLRPLWEAQTKGQTASLIDVLGDRVYVLSGPYLEFGSPTRYVTALDTRDGHPLWTHDARDTIFSEAALRDGLVLLTSVEGQRLALDSGTGRPTRAPKANKKGESSTAPLPPLACTTGNGQVTCAEQGSASPRWTLPVSEAVIQLRQTPERVCFVRTKALTIDCVDAASGALRFSHAVPRVPNIQETDAVHFDYRMVGKVLYVANYDAKVSAFSE